MKPSERLNKIEESKGCPECNGGCDAGDKDWLIERVKKLTEALEKYTKQETYGDRKVGDFIPVSIAMEALEE